jgi:hypothetical protein
VLLRRDGILANHKRVYRVYAAAHLQIRKRLKRRVAFGHGEPAPTVSTYNERWSLDFFHDTLRNGRRIRTLNIVDDFRANASRLKSTPRSVAAALPAFLIASPMYAGCQKPS